MAQVKENIKTCFVVTPIGKTGSDIRRHADGLIKMAIKPALGEEYDVKAAHDYVDSMSITKQVYEKLYESDLVIVNLTGLNPNVMYELGIRFCFGKPVILIAKEGEQLPFDITEYRTTFYKDDALGFSELKEELERVKKTIKYNDKEKSPIHDALRQNELFKQLKGEEKSDNTTNEALSLILEKIDAITNVNKHEPIVLPVTGNYDNIIKNRLIEQFSDRIDEMERNLSLTKSVKEKCDLLDSVEELSSSLELFKNVFSKQQYYKFMSRLEWMENYINSYKI